MDTLGAVMTPGPVRIRSQSLYFYSNSKVLVILTRNTVLQILNEKLCQICREQRKDQVAFPCRICTGSFHEKCLQEKGLLKSEEERSILRQALSNIGWSCYSCVGCFCLFDLETQRAGLLMLFSFQANLGSLMPPEEIVDLMNQFEFQDVNHGEFLFTEINAILVLVILRLYVSFSRPQDIHRRVLDHATQ